MSQRKICVVSATRAEYGLLYPLLKKIQMHPSLELALVVTGTHLLEEYGTYYKEIEKEFQIAAKVPMAIENDSLQILNAQAELQKDMGSALEMIAPDIVMLLGDRYEMLSVAIVAMHLNLPIGHIHGGEVTEGAQDEAIRHSITKMAHLHFTATEAYRQRVIQLGEEPRRVFNVGALGIENINSIELLSKEELTRSTGYLFAQKNLLVTLHPTTLQLSKTQEEIETLLSTLDRLDDTHLLFTKSNADAHSELINSSIEKYVQEHPNKAFYVPSLGQQRYLSMLRYVDAMVGNSSSGIIEAPSMKTPTINIGSRQSGRQKASSVIDVQMKQEEILDAIQLLYSPEFQKKVQQSKNPYQAKNVSQSIVDILCKQKFEGLLQKEFFDLKSSKERVLVVAVHPDDETLGCGGTLLGHKASGDSIHWLICTESDNKEFAAVRNKEIQSVAKMYDFDSLHNLHLTSTKVDEYAIGDIIHKISQVIQELQPTTLYLPFRNDVHTDHRTIFDAVFSCTKSFRYPFIEKIFMMETLSETEFGAPFREDMFLPTKYVNISSYLQKKLDIMRVYKSELGKHPFPRSEQNIVALATYRGATAGCEYAESFMLLKEIQK